MIEFIEVFAKEKRVDKIELNMSEFNESALAFSELVDFKTYRRYMSMDI